MRRLPRKDITSFHISPTASSFFRSVVPEEATNGETLIVEPISETNSKGKFGAKWLLWQCTQKQPQKQGKVYL